MKIMKSGESNMENEYLNIITFKKDYLEKNIKDGNIDIDNVFIDISDDHVVRIKNNADMLYSGRCWNVTLEIKYRCDEETAIKKFFNDYRKIIDFIQTYDIQKINSETNPNHTKNWKDLKNPDFIFRLKRETK